MHLLRALLSPLLKIQKFLSQTAFHPALRPITLGILGFALFNICFTLGITYSPLNAKFNFSYGNFLPAKLALLKPQHHQPPNILFLGTSQTNNGFIPAVFDSVFQQPAIASQTGTLHSFNLGLPNNRYDIMQAYLQYHQHRYGKPQLVLVELSPSIQEKNAALYFLPALYYRTLIEQNPKLTPTYLSHPLLADNVKQELLLSGLSSLRQYRYTFSPVNVIKKISGKMSLDRIGFFQRFIAPAEANPTVPLETSDVADAGENSPAAESNASLESSLPPAWMAQGWYPKPQSPHMTTPEGIRRSVNEARKYYIDQQPAVYFDKLDTLLTYCQQQGIPVVLVSWPNHPAFLQEFDRSPLHANYQAGLRQLLHKHPTPLIDLNAETPTSQAISSDGFFADPRHLTPTGAENFSRKLAQRLQQNDQALPINRTAVTAQ